jgi:hypothetical protein
VLLLLLFLLFVLARIDGENDALLLDIIIIVSLRRLRTKSGDVSSEFP